LEAVEKGCPLSPASRGEQKMKRTLLVLSFTPVFLLALVSQYALACCIDYDQDGYGIAYLDECPVPDLLDCDDDASDDPAICATCTCEEPECAPCARCINPGAAEAPYGGPLCSDGVDNDCDDTIDMSDEDCFECTVVGDCDDQNPCTDDACVGNVCVNENNSASCDDGDPCTMDDVCVGGSCVGGDPLDGDGDGHVSEECNGDDCDDSDPNVYPGLWEAPPEDPVCSDGIDNNCNGYTDLEDAGCVPETGWAPAESADAAVIGPPSQEDSRLPNLMLSLLLPIGAVVLLRRLFRRR
jgi:hypothetical protein